MPRPKSTLLHPSEWKVMKIVWQLKSCAARDVYTRAGELHGWSSTTVKTILSRLVDKGYLTTKQVGNCFVYRPSKSALKSLCNSVDALLENALEGTTGPLVAHILKKSRLSDEELDMLRSLLKEHKSGKDIPS